MATNKQMGTKYDRSNFFITINHAISKGNNVPEYDLSSSYFRTFKTNKKVRPFQLTDYDAHRPDRVSQQAYGVMDYWWIILKFNNVSDIWFEFNSGDIIKIPDIQDIKDFLKTVQKKKSKDEKLKEQEFKYNDSANANERRAKPN